MTSKDKVDPAEATELTITGGSESHQGEKTRDGGWSPGSLLRKVGWVVI